MNLCLIGKTCSGKNTIFNELCDPVYKLNKIIVYTTRPPRDGEIDGEDYYFVTDEQFQTLVDMNYFAVTSSYDISSNTIWFFGVAAEDVEQDSGLLIINPEWLDYFKNRTDSFIVYLYCNNEIMWNRLRERGSGSDSARRRVDRDAITFGDILDKVDMAIRNDGGAARPRDIANMIFSAYMSI